MIKVIFLQKNIFTNSLIIDVFLTFANRGNFFAGKSAS
jgi:hypothetical protein